MNLKVNHLYDIYHYPDAKSYDEEDKECLYEGARYLGPKMLKGDGVFRKYHFFKYWNRGLYEEFKIVSSRMHNYRFVDLGQPKFKRIEAKEKIEEGEGQ